MIVVSLFTRRRIPADVGRIVTRLHSPERIGMGVDRIGDLRER